MAKSSKRTARRGAVSGSSGKSERTARTARSKGAPAQARVHLNGHAAAVASTRSAPAPKNRSRNIEPNLQGVWDYDPAPETVKVKIAPRYGHFIGGRFVEPRGEGSGYFATINPATEEQLSVVFLTDSALARLHADFLADPTITDVITFEGDPLLGTAGEICISADAALRHVGPNPSALSCKSW